MTAKATAAFAGLEVRDTSHALDSSAGSIYSLEINGPARRRTKICRAIRFDRNRTEQHAGTLGIGMADPWLIDYMRGCFGKYLKYS